MIELEAGTDQAWPFKKVIDAVKTMKTHFPPWQERISGEPISNNLNSLFEELHLNNTLICVDPANDNYVPIRYKSRIIKIPNFLSSTQNDIISNAKDQMTFLKAFFNGYFFPKEKLHDLKKRNNIFFPFKYGIGIQKFQLPRILNRLQPLPEILGHCGSTGSVAFYIPEVQLYITGTINQEAMPQVAFQTIIRIIKKIRT